MLKTKMMYFGMDKSNVVVESHKMSEGPGLMENYMQTLPPSRTFCCNYDTTTTFDLSMPKYIIFAKNDKSCINTVGTSKIKQAASFRLEFQLASPTAFSSMDNQIKVLQDYLINMTVPDKRSSIDINPDHITMLQGTKNKKQLSRKKRTSKSSTLNRKEYAQIGLNSLPTRKMKYVEALPLHRLWKGYIKEHLGLKEGDILPPVYDRIYDAFSKLIGKIDFHGSILTVQKSKCSTLVGISGIVVLDTNNVFKMLGKDDRLRTVPKRECVFSMKFGNMDFTIFGKSLCIRPSDKFMKKIRSFIEPLDC